MATRCVKITAIAFSSTVNASELKNSIVNSNNQPATSRCAMKLASSRTTAVDWPGSSHSR
jgi:hypothetical protein